MILFENLHKNIKESISMHKKTFAVNPLSLILSVSIPNTFVFVNKTMYLDRYFDK